MRFNVLEVTTFLMAVVHFLWLLQCFDDINLHLNNNINKDVRTERRKDGVFL